MDGVQTLLQSTLCHSVHIDAQSQVTLAQQVSPGEVKTWRGAFEYQSGYEAPLRTQDAPRLCSGCIMLKVLKLRMCCHVLCDKNLAEISDKLQ